MIKSWATLEWYLPPEAETLPHFNLVGTQIRDNGSTTGLRAGDTVWVADNEEGPAGLAWEWVEVQPGVVMLADPNSIITNLQIVDSDHGPVSRLAKTIAVNRMVHALPWQPSVCSQLRATAANLPCRTETSARQWQAPHQPVRLEPGAGAAMLGASTALALRHAAGPQMPAGQETPHPMQGSGRRPALDAAARPHSRASDHENTFERRSMRDLRRAA